MKVVEAGYARFEWADDFNVTRKIERVGRVCYKSEDKICPGSDIDFCKMLMNRKHYAMLEHGYLVYVVDSGTYSWVKEAVESMGTCPSQFKDPDDMYIFSRMRTTEYELPEGTVRYVVSGNLRAFLEMFEYAKKNDGFYCSIAEMVYAVCDDTNGLIDYTACVAVKKESLIRGRVQRIMDMTNLSVSERWVHECLTVLFTVDRGVTHEIVRMRDCSFAQESTRYCNYSKGKFGNSITVIKPCFWSEDDVRYAIWKDGCVGAEKAYFELLDSGAIPQEARDVLPTSVKADIVVTANLSEWRHVLALRACDATGAAHPQMKEVMCPLCRELQEFQRYSAFFSDMKVADGK